MAYLQLTLDVAEHDIAFLELALRELGALSISLEPASHDAVIEPGPGSAPLWQETRLRALFAAGTEADSIAAALKRLLKRKRLSGYRLEELAERNWVAEFRETQRPRAFGKRLWVSPPGYLPPAAGPGSVVVELEPGLAFGSGQHPSTAQCLRWLDRHAFAESVLDYGCGSGILAIAALKLGARQATAVDIDEQALEAALRNAARNHVADRLRVCRPEQLAQDTFDLLLANILAQPLMQLAQQFADRVHAGGRIVLSGILMDQAPALAKAYETWFDMSRPQQVQEWALIAGKRRHDD